MTPDERLLEMVRQSIARLKRQWADEAVNHPLTPEGDELRRTAAAKFHVADHLLIEVRQDIERGKT
ncbi:hypothetical protein UFOVP399_46 [uncultured Caudovirales phage]|uniref:Uncharacterized protein n=1 Tax=uncultured Caudovirales phage TaxID=2100421 RepID=A0A6J5M785_9CAUD|nr:hypothetical protein UFOVP399_46 [uncultured Caudovirales phage]